MLTMAQLAQQVDQLTVEHLQIVARTLFTLPTSRRADADFVTDGLATEVLRFFFGNAWTNENVFSVHTDVSPQHRSGRKFLKTESTDEDEQFRHTQRVTTLAEIVFNLQGIEGMRQRLALMQNDDLEAALGEFECAVLLSAPEFKFRFVVPTGVKGQDYEGEAFTSAERVMCCEIKSKSERTKANPNSLWYTLDHARKQLPKGKPGMVLVKIPGLGETARDAIGGRYCCTKGLSTVAPHCSGRLHMGRMALHTRRLACRSNQVQRLSQ